MLFRPHFFRSFFTSVTCWLGVAVSLGLFYLVTSQIEKDSNAHFDSHTNNLLLVIEARIRSHVEILFATRAMFHANGEVTRKMFHDYVAGLDLPKRFPAITTVSYAPLVLHTDKPAFESSIRNDRSVDSNGYNGFAIKSSGMRAEYHVVSYVEPMKGNRDYLGFDIASTPCGGTALALLRGSGRELISSCRAASVDDTKRNAGPVIRLPLYHPGLPLAAAAERRAAFYGSIGVHFDVKRLMLDAVDGKIAPGVRLRLYDLDPIDKNLPSAISDSKHLLFDSLAIPDRRADSSPIATSADAFVKRTSLEVGSHGWEIEFSAPRDAMHFGFDAYFPWLILAGGLLMSMLVYGNYDLLLTARRHAVEIADDMTRDLRASRSDLAEAQHMAMLGSWLLDPGTASMTWSDETCRILDATGSRRNPQFEDFLAHIDERDRERIRHGMESSIRTGVEFNTEHRIVRSDGATRWVQTITRPNYHEPRPVLRGTIMDVTQRRHNLEALKRSHELLRELTAHQDRIKEDERKRIAREIHDELGQTLLALRLDVSMLDVRTAKTHPKLNERVRSMLVNLDATVKTVRTIINNLRPAVLDLGLNAAVEWQVNEFRRRSAIACELMLNANEHALSEAPATTLFRILQESLTNVMRHSGATEVRVELYDVGNNLVMKIADNGIGIDSAARNKARSFGLIGIEERVLALEGEFEIHSAPGRGTTLVIFIPLEKSGHTRPAEMQG